MAEGIFFYGNSGFVGPGSIGARLLENESGTYQGPWIPSHEFSRFSVMVSGLNSAAGPVTIYGANTDGAPTAMTDPGIVTLGTITLSTSAESGIFSWEYPVRFISAGAVLTAGQVWAFLQGTTP